MEKVISNQLACRILRSKIRQLDLKISNLPDFLTDDLKAERGTYARQLKEIREGQGDAV